MLFKKKYFWKKHFKFIFFNKLFTIYESFFTVNFSLFHFPSILHDLIRNKNSLDMNKSEYLLIYGKIIIYKSGILIIFFENFKFKLEKTKYVKQQIIINLCYKHNLILNIGNVVQFFDLIPLLYK
nr:hypothetical protein CcurKRNrm1_p006 [Cryptomonas curvata]